MITAAVFIVGIALRVLMFLSDKSPWSDEWFSIMLAQKPFAEVLWGSIRDVHPPLYFVLLRALVVFFGDAEWVFRFLSFLSGLGLLGAIYFLAKEILDQKVARVVLYLAAISPYWLQTANEIRSYSLLSFLTCLGTFFLVKAVREPQAARWRWAYLSTAALSVYVEHVAWFWLGAATVYLAILFFKDRRVAGAVRFHGSVLFLAAPSLILTVYQAVYREDVFNFDRIKEYLPPLILLKKAVGIFWHFSSGYFYSMITVEALGSHLKSSPFFWMSAVTSLLALFFAGKGWLGLYKKRPVEGMLFAVALVFPLAILGIFYAIRLDARYLSFAAPFYFILLGIGVSLTRRWIQAAFMILFTAVNMFGAFQAVISQTDAIHKEDYKNMISYVLENAASRDAVCESNLAVNYYQKIMNRRFKGVYFPHAHDFFISGRDDFDRVWMMDSVNMHSDERERRAQLTLEKFEALGYRLAGEPILFGGPEALPRLYIFERAGEF